MHAHAVKRQEERLCPICPSSAHLLNNESARAAWSRLSVLPNSNQLFGLQDRQSASLGIQCMHANPWMPAHSTQSRDEPDNRRVEDTFQVHEAAGAIGETVTGQGSSSTNSHFGPHTQPILLYYTNWTIPNGRLGPSGGSP